MVCLGNEPRSFSHFFRLHPGTEFWTLLLTMRATPFLLKDSCPQKIKWSFKLNSPIPFYFSSLIPKMSIFSLAISCLTKSNLPWFMDLTFRFMLYCSLQHQTLLSPPDTFTLECHFHFGPVTLFFLELLVIDLCSSPVVYWTPGGAHLLVSYPFAFSYGSLDSHSKNVGVVCHSLLQWTTFCQNSPPWPVCLGWPCMTRLMASLSYASPITMTRLQSMKGWAPLHRTNGA